MKREKIWRIIGGTGFVLLIVGGCAMDSESLSLPIMMVLVGLVLCSLSARVLYRDEA